MRFSPTDGVFRDSRPKGYAAFEVQGVLAERDTCGRALLLVVSTATATRRLRMLQAFIDDSGRGNEPIYILAGWIAEPSAWASFSDQWKEALIQPPAISYFEMKEAASCTGQFHGWQNDKRDEKLVRLAKIIQRHSPFGIGFAMKHIDYSSAVKRRVANIPGVEKQLRDPYFFSCYGLMIGLLKFQHELGASVPVNFVFDEQGKLSSSVDEAYDDLKALPADFHPLISARPVHRDDKEVLPLQAADMFAWHARRFFADTIENKELHESAAFSILASIPQIGFLWDFDQLDSAISAVLGDLARRGLSL